MKFVAMVIALVCSYGLFGSSLSAQDGAALFSKHCAGCHEAAGESRAPGRAALKQLSQDRILTVLETGVMFRQGLERTPAERRAIAAFLSDNSAAGEALNPIPRSAFCANGNSFRDPLTGPAWNGWGVTLTNSRFEPADAAGLTPQDVPRLKLKWAFAFPGDINASAQPVIAGGRLYTGSFGRKVYSLDANTGCIYWMIDTESGVRSAISIGPLGGGKFAAYFGDMQGNVYAVDAATGALLWKVKVDDHPSARITAALKYHDGRLYVPVTSTEEIAGEVATYECCKFRGSVVALDAASGKQLWKTYTIEEQARPSKKNRIGTQLYGPAGAGVWNSPTIDVKRNAVYVGTGNDYSYPASSTSDAIMAFDLKTGKINWVHQLMADDKWNSSCRPPGNPTGRGDAINCPDPDAPDADFGASTILVQLKNRREILLAPQKSGITYALDPDRKGAILWQVYVGEVRWGAASDGVNGYFPAIAVGRGGPTKTVADPKNMGSLSAVSLTDGKKIWSVAPLACPPVGVCPQARSAAVTVIPGVVFSGSIDGKLRAYSTTDGKVLWEYDTATNYQAVNGVPAKGGAMESAGQAVVGGMLYANSGYARMGAVAGNVLLAFSVDGK